MGNITVTTSLLAYFNDLCHFAQNGKTVQDTRDMHL